MNKTRPRNVERMANGDRLFWLTLATMGAIFSGAFLARQAQEPAPPQMHVYLTYAIALTTIAVALALYTAAAAMVANVWIEPARVAWRSRRQERRLAAAMRAADAASDTPDAAMAQSTHGGAYVTASATPDAASATPTSATPDQAQDMRDSMRHIEIAIEKLEDARKATIRSAKAMGLQASEHGGRFFLYDPTRRQTYAVRFKLAPKVKKTRKAKKAKSERRGWLQWAN